MTRRTDGAILLSTVIPLDVSRLTEVEVGDSRAPLDSSRDYHWIKMQLMMQDRGRFRSVLKVFSL